MGDVWLGVTAPCWARRASVQCLSPRKGCALLPGFISLAFPLLTSPRTHPSLWEVRIRMPTASSLRGKVQQLFKDGRWQYRVGVEDCVVLLTVQQVLLRLAAKSWYLLLVGWSGSLCQWRTWFIGFNRFLGFVKLTNLCLTLKMHFQIPQCYFLPRHNDIINTYSTGGNNAASRNTSSWGRKVKV